MRCWIRLSLGTLLLKRPWLLHSHYKRPAWRHYPIFGQLKLWHRPFSLWHLMFQIEEGGEAMLTAICEGAGEAWASRTAKVATICVHHVGMYYVVESSHITETRVWTTKTRVTALSEARVLEHFNHGPTFPFYLFNLLICSLTLSIHKIIKGASASKWGFRRST